MDITQYNLEETRDIDVEYNRKINLKIYNFIDIQNILNDLDNNKHREIDSVIISQTNNTIKCSLDDIIINENNIILKLESYYGEESLKNNEQIKNIEIVIGERGFGCIHNETVHSIVDEFCVEQMCEKIETINTKIMTQFSTHDSSNVYILK